jgi:hypothetical protein
MPEPWTLASQSQRASNPPGCAGCGGALFVPHDWTNNGPYLPALACQLTDQIDFPIGGRPAFPFCAGIASAIYDLDGNAAGAYRYSMRRLKPFSGHSSPPYCPYCRS